LIALLEEGDVSHAIPRLAELGAEKEIHPHVVADNEAVQFFDRLRELNTQYGLGVPPWRLGLEALAASFRTMRSGRGSMASRCAAVMPS
jgi:hypothetical protein